MAGQSSAFSIVPIQQKINTIVGVIDLTYNIETKNIKIGILYNPNSSLSLKETEELSNTSEIYNEDSDTHYTFSKISSENLNDIQQFNTLVITSDISNEILTKLSNESNKGQILTIATTPECVADGLCLVGINTQNSNIDVVMNKKASDKANIHFAPAFRFIAKQL